MAWVFICIAVGAALFLIWIIIDYLRVSSGLKPKAYLARQEIRECEMKIETEQSATGAAKQAVEVLTKEVEELEKDLVELQKKVDEYQEKEKKRKPTKYKLEG
jgi:peptidoglycan hydrolase CwlO-like protein